MTVTRTLYVRGVPDALLRKAKALAAERGTTLGALVVDSLEKAVEPQASGAGRPHPLQAEMEWYRRHLPGLVRRHRGEYLAILGEGVVDSDADFSKLAEPVFERYGRRPIFIPRCQPDERTARLPSPRRRDRRAPPRTVRGVRSGRTT